jgi:hypothetical protein
MENATTFDEAVKKLKSTDLIAPAYFILGGLTLDEGVVLTRNQFKLIDQWKLNSTSTGPEKWYLLETNYDHWVDPPTRDDRRTPGMKAMNEITQDNINFDSLMRVLTINPVCNK